MEFTPYLNFNGNCAEAFKFYEQLFGGKIQMMQTHGETPARDHVPPEWHGAVIHASLLVDGKLLMASDAPPAMYKPAEGMWVSVGVASVAEGRRIFNALADGGRVTMPYEQTFWSPGFGMVVDRFGTPWMINSNPG